jgi:hypothetical protein
MEEIKTLRTYIREVLRNIKKQQKFALKQEMNEERSMRKTIRKLLREKQDIALHKSTGINVLSDLLDTIVPTLKSEYSKCQTDKKQRDSFKAHILRGIQNLLSTASVYYSADKRLAGGAGAAQPNQPPAAMAGEATPTPAAAPAGKLKEQGEEAATGTPQNNPKFIDVGQPKQKKPDPSDAFEAIAGEEETGRNIAHDAFKKIQRQILQNYSLLANDKDRETFYDYLLTNVALHIDAFETELSPSPEMPTTPEYEAEKAKIASSLQGSAPPTGAEAAPQPVPAAAPMGAPVPPEETPA